MQIFLGVYVMLSTAYVAKRILGGALKSEQVDMKD